MLVGVISLDGEPVRQLVNPISKLFQSILCSWQQDLDARDAVATVSVRARDFKSQTKRASPCDLMRHRVEEYNCRYASLKPDLELCTR